MGNYTILGGFVNPRRGREARNLTTNVPKILDLKSSSEQIFCKNCRWVPLTQVPNMVRVFEKTLTTVWTQWQHYLQCGPLPFPPFSTKKYMKLILLLITLRFRVVNNIQQFLLTRIGYILSAEVRNQGRPIRELSK